MRIDRGLLAYCAGVLDSDGYIGVRRSTYWMRTRKGGAQPIYSERICVKQAEPHAVVLLHELFGGHLLMAKPAANTKRGRPLYSWSVTDLKAAECLKALAPYLRIKKQQAFNCLELRDAKNKSKKERVAYGRGHVGSARRSDFRSKQMEDAYLHGKYLNRVGVRDAEVING